MVVYPSYRWPIPSQPHAHWTVSTSPVTLTFQDSRVDELLKAVEELTKRVDLLTEEVVATERKKPSPDDPADPLAENVFLLNDRIEKLTRRISDLENGVRF